MVLVIIGVILAMVGPRVFNSLGRANAERAKVQIEGILLANPLIGSSPPLRPIDLSTCSTNSNHLTTASAESGSSLGSNSLAFPLFSGGCLSISLSRTLLYSLSCSAVSGFSFRGIRVPAALSGCTTSNRDNKPCDASSGSLSRMSETSGCTMM